MSAQAEGVSAPARGWTGLARNWLFILQLALVVLVVHLYEIEGAAFSRVITLAAAGFVVSVALPVAYRLPFFVLLSISGIFIVLGMADGAWLMALGLILIGVCHLPLSLVLRVVVLLAVGGLLAALRAGWTDAPWSPAIWPILGSMFMFRLVLYVRAMKSGQADRGLWGTLAYFFMLPNVAFPLFPVIDYQTFRRTHFDRSEAEIYQQGLQWISRGLVHLVVYRFVYHNALIDPEDVLRLSDLVQFMLGTFLLYLKVSGQFHLIVGLLHLFGFRLPETHKLYYLAHSFTELWRRINIYWTDFMTKVVFYPIYFKAKRLPPGAAIGLATAGVFATTWLLHSYQWFWLRGGFPITLQDALFWGILGSLVVVGALKELRKGKAAKTRAAGYWSWKQGLRSVVTFCVFCFLWSLWSTESVGQWIWMLGAAASVDTKGVALLAGILLIVAALGGRDWEAVRSARPQKWLELATQPAVRATGGLIVLLALFVAAQGTVQGAAPARLAAALGSLQMTGLNARDAALQHRGYYEQLDVRGQINAPVFDAGAVAARQDWDDPAAAGILRDRQDLIERDLVPSRAVVWNGHKFSTNGWGLRDGEYSAEKPRDTLRIALLGPSHVMGNGVGDGETFEQLVEDRLNRELTGGRYLRFEILNFGVDGHTLPQQLALLEDRVFKFSPDIVIVTQYHRGRTMTERYLQKIVRKNIAVPDGPLRALLAEAGLAEVDRGNIPIPFASGRELAKWLGMQPRMPHGESAARIRRIADDVNEWSIQRIAEVTRSRGATGMVLALNAVIDDAPGEIPNLRAIQQARLPVLDLFDVFPASERAALRVAPWDDHPNAAGHRVISERLFGELLPVLQRFPGPDVTTSSTVPE